MAVTLVFAKGEGLAVEGTLDEVSDGLARSAVEASGFSRLKDTDGHDVLVNRDLVRYMRELRPGAAAE